MTKKNTLGLPLFMTLLVSVAYLPFLNLRVLRMAGDEKVYVSQAIEMARGGRWFVQTMADVPDYYKGPFHYVMIRIGIALFGSTLFAGVYMNYVLILMAGLALYFATRKIWGEEKAFLFGTAVALNVGVFSHALASQMEVELCALYALAMAALLYRPAKARATLTRDFWLDLPFWATAGIAGWVKSPVHSLLIGLGGVLFWLLTGTLWSRLKKPGAWLSALCGIVICIAGYAPAFLADGENFSKIFLGRENLEKPDNGRHIDYVLRSLPHFLFPWSAVVLAGLVTSLLAWKRKQGAVLKRLGWAMALPTLIFFCAFPYKGQNYNLPAIAALLLIGFSSYEGLPKWSGRIAGALIFVVTTLLSTVLVHFFWSRGLPAWWSQWWIAGTLLCLVLSAALFLVYHSVRAQAVAATLLFLGFGAAITPVGEREMIGIRHFVAEHPSVTLYYYNLEPTIWSEWGLLELVLHKTVYGVHRVDQLTAAVKPGHALLVPGAEALGMLEQHAKQEHVNIKTMNITAWPRWRTKGMAADGKPLWRTAWDRQDLSVLEREFYILWME